MVKMITRTASILGILLLVAAGTLCAQEADPAQEAEHNALRALTAEVTQAINNQNIDQLGKYLAEEFVFTAVDQTVLTDVASIKAYYDRMIEADDSPVTSFQIAPAAAVLTRFLDADTGYCYGTSEDTYILRSNGQKVSLPSRWTALVVKENGQWKIKAVHSGVNFMDNPVIDGLKMLARRNQLIAALIGILLGLGVGVLAGRKSAKGKGNNG
jgi:ketosteroid isomerase-like protein